jgi:zinc transport system ATP-binding protein
MNPPVVEIKNVSFAYSGQPVLQDVSLDIRIGDFIAMIGPNGGGKTTLLKLILGLLKPNRGTIKVMGEATQKASHHIGYVPQNVNINQNFPITAMDVVMMGKLEPGRRWKRPTASDRRDAMAAIDRMEMAPLAGRRIADLSGGQRQRIFIARALVTKPQLLLLDEPTASIDTKGQTDFYKLLRELNKDITILVVSHDLLVISTYAKSMACMNRRLHYHNQNEITGDMLKSMYACTVEEICPVELITQGHSSRATNE